MSRSRCPAGRLCQTGRNSHKAILTGCVRENRADGPSGHSCCWCRGIITKHGQLKAHVSWSCNHCIIHIFWITVGSVEYVQYNKCCMLFLAGTRDFTGCLATAQEVNGHVMSLACLLINWRISIGCQWWGSKWCNSSWGGHECLGLISWQTI